MINHLDQRRWQQYAPEPVPERWVEYAVEPNLKTFLAWIDGSAPTLEIVFRTEALPDLRRCRIC